MDVGAVENGHTCLCVDPGRRLQTLTTKSLTFYRKLFVKLIVLITLIREQTTRENPNETKETENVISKGTLMMPMNILPSTQSTNIEADAKFQQNSETISEHPPPEARN